MATGNGGLHFEPTMDIGQIRQSSKEVKKEITDATRAVEGMGTAFDLMTDITKQDIKDQKQYISDLEKEYAKLESRIKGMPNGASRDALQGKANTIRHEIESEKEALDAMEIAVERNSKAHQSFRTQLRQVNLEMMNLASNGQKDTEAYRALQAKAVELQKNMREVGKELSLLSGPGTGFQVVASGLSAVTGTMAAANGVMALFGSESKNLNEIMTRMQSLMAITIGLQQVSTTVSKQGAVMIGIEAMQRAAVAKAAQMQAKGTVAATIAQKAFNVVAKANPYVLLAMALITVVGALYAFSKGAKKASDEMKKFNESLNESIAESASKSVEQVTRLSNAWNKLGDDMKAKQRFIEENAESFKQLGVNVRTVEEAENLLVKNKDAFVRSQMEKAKAVAAASMAQEIMAKKLKAELELEQTPETVTRQHSTVNRATGTMHTWTTTETNKDYTDIQDKIKGYDDDLKKLYGIVADSEAAAVKELEDAGIKSWNEYEEGTVGAIQKALSKKRNELLKAKSADEYKAIAKEVGELEKQLQKITGGKFDPEKEKRKLEQYLSELRKARERAKDLYLANLEETPENKEKKIREDFGRQIGDAETNAAKAATPELAEAYKEQAKELRKAMEKAVDDVYADEARKNKEFLVELLTDYGDYITKKKVIDNKYFNDVTALEKKLMEAQIAGDTDTAESLKKAIDNAKKEWAKADFNIEMDTIDTTAYESIEERMDAINEAYEKYKKSLEEVGASEAEIAAVEQERVETAGKLKTLLAQQEDLERKIENAISESNDNTDEYKNWVKLLDEVKKQIKEIKDKTEEATTSTETLADAWKEAAKKIQNASEAEQFSIAGSFMQKWAKVEGTNGFNIIGTFLSALGDPIQGFANITDMFIDSYLDNLDKVYEKKEKQLELERELTKAHYDELNAGRKSVFGEDVIGSIDDYLTVLDEVTKKTKYAYALFYGGEGFNLDNALSGSVVGNNGTLLNKDAMEKLLQGNLGDISLKVKNNFLGIGQEYETLANLSEQIGMDLYDQYGNINAEFAQYILDTYDTLSAEQRDFLQRAIDDSAAYADAMQNIADYIESLFGNVADTIADQFIESFLESGQAAMDFDKVVSDVTRNMVKNLIKSIILDEVMNKYTEKFKYVMTGGKYKNEQERQAAMLDLFIQMGNDIEATQPYIQSILEAYKQYIGDLDSETAAMSGNLLQSASQDSVSLLNGQLNAMRVYQGRMETMMTQVLWSLSGIRDDMNQGFGETVSQLRQIETNTSDRGSILRSLGEWIG